MKILIISAIAVLGISALILLLLHIRTLKPVRSILLHAGIGLAFLVAVNLLSRFTGIKIPVNLYSVLSSAVLGVPAVCGFLILNLIL